MSIATELTRLARNVGALTADTTAIFEALRAKGVPVPANAQLSDVASLIDTIEDPSTVTIGGLNYKTMQYGNKKWTTESLKYPTSNSYRPNGTDEYGLLYPYSDFSSINSVLPSGWRIPTKSDFEDLFSINGNISNDYISREFGGNNSNGFNLELLGFVNSNGEFNRYGERGYSWTSTDYTNTNCLWNMWCGSSTIDVDDYTSKSNSRLQVRVVRDIS